MTDTCPIPETYWLLEGRLLAGSHPGSWTREKAIAKLELFLAAGIRSFIDLTETSEPLDPYDEVLAELACGRGLECRYQRFGFRDRGVPTRERMTEILTAIGNEMELGRAVYLHCWGGIGRTGTVAACWLVEQGLPAEESLSRVQVLRWGRHEQWQRSPETDEQRDFVRSWKRSAGTGSLKSVGASCAPFQPPGSNPSIRRDSLELSMDAGGARRGRPARRAGATRVTSCSWRRDGWGCRAPGPAFIPTQVNRGNRGVSSRRAVPWLPCSLRPLTPILLSQRVYRPLNHDGLTVDGRW